MLTLDRPLVLFDLEATGTDPSTARIIQIAARQLVPGEEGPMPGRVFNQLVNPGLSIPDEVVELTGITDADVAEAPRFPDVVPAVQDLIGDADLAGFNVHNYDMPLLTAEYERAGEVPAGPDDREVIDVLRLEQVLRPRTLEALYREYTGNDLEGAHDASADVDGTLAVLAGQLEEHQPPVSTPGELAEFIRGDYLDDGRRLKQCDNGDVELCFGKHAGKTIAEVYDESPGYIDWMRREITELRVHIDDALS
jgi:DNA polymerase-3 subunit epsilon